MVERIALFQDSTVVLITITIILTIVFSFVFTFSQGSCPFVIWMILLLLYCFFILPLVILRKKRDEIELSSASSFKLSHLLEWAARIQIIQDGTEITINNFSTVSDTTIKWYEGYLSRRYNVVEGIKAGDTVLIDGAKLIII